MADHTKDISDSDTAKDESGHTKSGQEAMRGVGPGAHDREHQSNYGGGGENGGSSGTKDRASGSTTK
jgi:hypothetical protein